MANSFDMNGFNEDVSDIAFEDAYCIYIGILKEQPETEEELLPLL